MSTPSGQLRIADLTARLEHRHDCREPRAMGSESMLLGQLMVLGLGLFGLTQEVTQDLLIMLGAGIIAIPGGWCFEMIEAKARKVQATPQERRAKWVISILFTAGIVPVLLRHFLLVPWPSMVMVSSLVMSGSAWSLVLLIRALGLKFARSALGRWLGLGDSL